MLIARPSDEGFIIIDGFSRIVRLGEGLAQTGILGDEAMARTIAALRVCADKLKHHGVRRVRAVATAACRRAENSGTFIEQVAAETGLAMEPISAEDEASLTLSGCAPLMRSGHGHGLLFDIGGGSTEVTWARTPDTGPPRALDLISLPLGVVTLADEFGFGILTPAQFEEIVSRVDGQIAPFCAANDIQGAVARDEVQMIGTSGTVTTLGALHLGLTSYDRARIDGLSIDMTHVRTMSARLSELDCEARRALPCVGPGRADLMLMGCAVLAAITRRWPVPAVRVADRGIREGLIMGMIDADQLGAKDTGAA